MKKAFTVVEVMIVVVVLGLLGAMAIPAYQKVRTDRLASKVGKGETLSETETEYLREHRSRVVGEYTAAVNVYLDGNKVERPTSFERIVVIDGQAYRLVPVTIQTK